MVDDCVPKEFRRYTGRLVAGVDVLHQHSQHLRTLSVAVLSGEFVFATLEWIEKGVMIEAMRQGQPSLIAGVSIKIRQHFVHAAKLSVEHFLRLFRIELS